MLLYIVYGILFVDTVDTKIKVHNALCYIGINPNTSKPKGIAFKA